MSIKQTLGVNKKLCCVDPSCRKLLSVIINARDEGSMSEDIRKIKDNTLRNREVMNSDDDGLKDASAIYNTRTII